MTSTLRRHYGSVKIQSDCRSTHILPLTDTELKAASTTGVPNDETISVYP